MDLDDLWMMLHQSRDAIFKLRERELNKFGISTPKAEILCTIQDIGYLATPTEISRRVLREFHSVSSIISRMEKQGLVKKIHDMGRKNLTRICLTDKGKQIYHEVSNRKTIVDILSCLSETERKQMLSSLRKVRNEALRKLGIEDRKNLLGY